jgi:hypothetical protein
VVFPVLVSSILLTKYKPLRATPTKRGAPEKQVSQQQAKNERAAFNLKFGDLIAEYRTFYIGINKVVIVHMASFVTQTSVALLVTYSEDLPCMAILPLTYMTVVNIALVLLIRPYKSVFKTYLHLFNLSTQLFLCYLLLLFTDFVDLDVQQRAGNVFIYVLLANVVGNLAIFVMPVVPKARFKLKVFFHLEELRRRKINRARYNKRKA